MFQPVRWSRASYAVDRSRRINIPRSLRRRTAAAADAVSAVTDVQFPRRRRFATKRNLHANGVCLEREN